MTGDAAGLLLDPGDGRDVGLRLARHKPLRIPAREPELNTAALAASELIGEASRRVCENLADDLAVVARRAADGGMGAELVNMQTSGRWVGGRYYLDAWVTVRIGDMP